MEQKFLITNNKLETHTISITNFNIYYMKLNNIYDFFDIKEHKNLNIINNEIVKVKHNINENSYFINKKHITKNITKLEQQLKFLTPLNKKSHKIMVDKNNYILNCYKMDHDEIKICLTNKVNQYTAICKYLSFNITNLLEFNENNLFKKINNMSLENSENILFKDLFNISTANKSNVFFPDNQTLSNFMNDLIKNTNNDKDLEENIIKINKKYNLFISKNEDPIKLTNQKIKNYFHLLKLKNDPIMMKNELYKLDQNITPSHSIKEREVIKIKHKMNSHDFGR